MTWTGTLTLHQCNGLVTKLRTHLWWGNRAGGCMPELSVPMNMGDMFLCNNYIEGIKSRLDKLDSQLQEQIDVYNAIYYLRSSIVQANCNTGINQCLSDINCATDKLGFLQNIKNRVGNECIDRVFLDSIVKDEGKSSMDGLVSAVRRISVVSAASLDEQIQALQIAITGLEQKRDSLNNEKVLEVTLPDNIAKLLALSS